MGRYPQACPRWLKWHNTQRCRWTSALDLPSFAHEDGWPGLVGDLMEAGDRCHEIANFIKSAKSKGAKA